MRRIDTPLRYGFLTSRRHGALIPVVRMELIVYVPVELRSTMKPRPHADEDAVVEPLWSVVTRRCTGIRSDVVIAVGTVRGDSNFDPDLSLCVRRESSDADYGKRG